MKILLMNGSPRKNGNTQLILNLYRTLLQEQNGVQNFEVASIYLTEQTIEPCHGCRACIENSENHCPCKDDVTRIEVQMKEADLIIIGTPVYVEDISGLMKMWIDRMAYHCHRPFLNGKPVFLLTTSGANASNHARKTLKHALLAWGATVIQSHNYSMGAKMEAADAKIKFEEQIKRSIQIFSHRQKKNRIPMFSLIAFNVQKKFWLQKGKEANSYDYRYWKSQGWLDKQSVYYYPVSQNPLTCFLVKLVGTFVGLILY